MPENGNLTIGYHTLLGDSVDGSVDDSNYREYVLDGQQRITSIAKIFLAIDNKYEYYFDLLAILVEKYPDDGIEGDEGVKIKYSKSQIGEIFCRKFPRGKDGDEQEIRQHSRFISGKRIIDNKFGSVVSRFLSAFTMSDDLIDKYTDYLNAVLGSVGGYSIPATSIAGDSELGIVIRVFEKVNSTGKKLTLFDLINAKSFQVNEGVHGGGLSSFLTKNILDKIGKNHKIQKGVFDFLKFSENEDKFEKLDRITRIFEISALLDGGRVPAISQAAMLKREAEFWFESWNKKGDMLLEIIDWMSDEDLIDIAQIPFLEYASAIFLSNYDAFKSPKFKNEIKKHALYLTLNGSSFTKSNLDTVDRFVKISEAITNDHASTKYDYNSPSAGLNLSSSDVLGFSFSKSQCRAILNIFYKQNVGGMFVFDIVGNHISKMGKSGVDVHHIYPKSRVKNFSPKSIFNTVANMILIHDEVNRFDIKDKSPAEYFSKIKMEKDGDFWCSSNLIDISEAVNVESEMSAEIFVKNRAAKIAEVVNKYFAD